MRNECTANGPHPEHVAPLFAALPEGKTYTDFLNPDSLKIVEGALLEKSLAEASAGEKFQFVRDGYYVKDTKYENTFNRVVGLKDSFPKK